MQMRTSTALQRGAPGLFKLLSIFAFTILGVSSANSGEVLRLKAGEVSIPAGVHAIGAMPTNRDSHFVVQFQNHITSQNRQDLRKLGLEILRYLPDDAYVVSGSYQKTVARASEISNLRLITTYQPAWALSETVAAGINVFNRNERVLINVRIFSPTSLKSVVQSLGAISGLRVDYAQNSVVLVDVERSNVSQIAGIDGVEWVQEQPTVQTMHIDLLSGAVRADSVSPDGKGDYKDLTGYESGTKLMNLEAAYAKGFAGDGQIVAIADTGMDTGVFSTLNKDLSNTTKGYTMGMYATGWQDGMGHGTHVSGSVAGTGSNSGGALHGAAYKAGLMMEGMWSPMFDNLTVNPDFNVLMGSPYNDGARIHTNSWGAASNFGKYDSMAAAADDFMWNHPDMLILFAAGNSALDANKDGVVDENSVGSPGTAKNVLTVGASKNLLLAGGIQKMLKEVRPELAKNWPVEPLASSKMSENSNGIAAFSSRGPTTDGRLKPEIVAPGTNIVSVHTHLPRSDKSDQLWGLYNDDYAYSGGTSMATPLVAGAAAVTREFATKQLGFSNPSGALVKALLMHSAADLYPGQFGTGPTQELATRRPNNHEGFGRVDMDKLTATGSISQVVDNTSGVATGETSSGVTVQVGKGHYLMATLAYTDAPGSVSSAKSLVNDIALVVQFPDGHQEVRADHVNNCRAFELLGTAAEGTYTVFVKGDNVPMGKSGRQPYALVVSAH